MRPGTPGFVGARLREAREARGMTPASLADVLGVSRQAVSQYESGQQSPRPEVMEKLPAVLNVPARYFFRPARDDGDDTAPLFFRSLAAATKDARARAARRAEWFFDVVHFVEQFVALPPADLPRLAVPADPRLLTDERIEDAATDVRRHWRLGDGVISDLVLLLETRGVVVSRGELWSEHLDAFSRWRGERPVVFLGSDKASAARSRFDAAHELGHLVLHRAVPQQTLQRPELFKLIERQAHRFASAFLLPAPTFLAHGHAPTLESLRALKPVTRVSIGAMLHRAADLGLVSDPSALWRSYARRGWKREEPLDRELPPEEPRLLRRALELILREGGFGAADLLSRFDIPAKDVEELAGLAPGFLDARLPPVRLLTLRQRSADGVDDRAGGEGPPAGAGDRPAERPARSASVLPFPSRRRD